MLSIDIPLQVIFPSERRIQNSLNKEEEAAVFHAVRQDSLHAEIAIRTA
jgi:hypothetical protein